MAQQVLTNTWAEVDTATDNMQLLLGAGLSGVTILGGTVNATTVGAVTPSTGAFTALTSTGGTLNGSLGTITPATGEFTTADVGTFSLTGATEGWEHTGIQCSSSRDSTAGRSHYLFHNPNGTVGNIETNGTATAYNTSSDPRLKSDFVPIDGALALTMLEQAHDNLWTGVFYFRSDPTTPVSGYNAHALVDYQPGYGGSEGRGPRTLDIGEVYQEQILEQEVDDNGDLVFIDQDPVMVEVQPELIVTPAGVDQSKRVPLLEAAIYELLQRIKVLEQ